MAQLQGCKLPRALENPIDDLLMVLVEPTLQPLHSAGVTPNMVTLASAAAAAASVYFCFQGRVWPAAGLWVAGYILDVMDGFMARRFDMESRLGDALDHCTDLLGYGGLIAFVLHSLVTMHPRIYWPLAVELILCAAALYQMNCQEKETSYIAIKGIGGCACKDKAHLKYSRWGGMGTLMAWHVFLIYFYTRHK